MTGNMVYLLPFLCSIQVLIDFAYMAFAWIHKVKIFFGSNAVVLNLFWPVNRLCEKYPVGHFAMLTPHEQLVETVLHIGQ